MPITIGRIFRQPQTQSGAAGASTSNVITIEVTFMMNHRTILSGGISSETIANFAVNQRTDEQGRRGGRRVSQGGVCGLWLT